MGGGNTLGGKIEVHYRFTPRLLNVFYTLFLVMLQFSGIGIPLFCSLLSTSSADIL